MNSKTSAKLISQLGRCLLSTPTVSTVGANQNGRVLLTSIRMLLAGASGDSKDGATEKAIVSY